MRATSVSASTEAWPSLLDEGVERPDRFLGVALGGGDPGGGELEVGASGGARAGGGVEDDARLGHPPGVEQAADEAGREEEAEVDRHGGEGRLRVGEEGGVAPGGGGAGDGEPEGVAARAGGVGGERAAGEKRAALDGAGEVGEEGAVLDGGVGEGGEERLGLGAEAEADVEPGEVAHRLGVRRVELAHELAGERGHLGGEGEAVRPGADVEAGVLEADRGRAGPGFGAGGAGVAVVDGGRGDLVVAGEGGEDAGRVLGRAGGGGGGIGGGVGGGEADDALIRRALDLLDEHGFGARHRLGLAGLAGFGRLGGRLGEWRGRGRGGVAVGDVEGEVLGADEGGADAAVAAEIER